MHNYKSVFAEFFLFEAPPEALSKWKILLLFMNFT
jgi:hypothetical protein